LVYVCTIMCSLIGMHLSNFFLSCRNTPCQVEPRILQQQRSCGKRVRSSLACNQMIHTSELILYHLQQRLSVFLIPWIPHEFFLILLPTSSKLSQLADPYGITHGNTEIRILRKKKRFNPLNPELNPICYLLALLGAHRFLHVSRIRVKLLTFRLLMSYIYGAPILDVSRSHTTTQHSR